MEFRERSRLSIPTPWPCFRRQSKVSFMNCLCLCKPRIVHRFLNSLPNSHLNASWVSKYGPWEQGTGLALHQARCCCWTSSNVQGVCWSICACTHCVSVLEFTAVEVHFDLHHISSTLIESIQSASEVHLYALTLTLVLFHLLPFWCQDPPKRCWTHPTLLVLYSCWWCPSSMATCTRSRWATMALTTSILGSRSWIHRKNQQEFYFNKKSQQEY